MQNLLLPVVLGLYQIASSGRLEVTVLDAEGLASRVEVHVEIVGASKFQRLSTITSKGWFDLPYGEYRVKCWSDTAFCSPRLIHIRQPKMHLVLGLHSHPMGTSLVDEPWQVQGTVESSGRPGMVIARLVGLYSASLDDAVVGPDGRFALAAWTPGEYRLLLVSHGTSTVVQTIKITYLTPRTLQMRTVVMPPKADQ